MKISGRNNESNEAIEYTLDVIYYDGDLLLDGKNNIDGAKLKNNIYEFGNILDVGTEEKDASNMVVLKVNGNLKIENGITLTTIKSEENYGGLKVF